MQALTRVIGNYLLAAIYVVLDFALAWAAAWVATRKAPNLASSRYRTVAFVFGSALLLIAGIGRLGWSIQSLGGVSPPEALDRSIFLGLSLVGTFLLVMEYALGRLRR